VAEAFHHTPVLLHSALSVLTPRAGETVLDVTVGLGGHAEEFLRCIGKSGHFIGLDADEENLSAARNRLSAWGDAANCVHANFRSISTLQLPSVDIIFADLGLSSPHVDDPGRGFTFRQDVPLDLRFDRSIGLPASEWLKSASTEQIAGVLRDFGEMRGAHRFAEQLQEHQVRTTFDVVHVAEDVFGWRAKALLPKVFQALRIAVNDELDALDHLLADGPALLKPGGRMGVISYHSLEDRRVKQRFRALTTPSFDDRTGAISVPAEYTLLTRKAIVPSPEECSQNSRARSAKFRAILRSPLHS